MSFLPVVSVNVTDMTQSANKKINNQKDVSSKLEMSQTGGPLNRRDESERYESVEISSNGNANRTPIFKMHLDITKERRRKSRRRTTTGTSRNKSRSPSPSLSPRTSGTVILMKPNDELSVTVEMEPISQPSQASQSKTFNRTLSRSKSDTNVYTKECKDKCNNMCHSDTCRNIKNWVKYQKFCDNIDKHCAMLDVHLRDLRRLLIKPQMTSASVQTNEDEIFDYSLIMDNAKYTMPHNLLIDKTQKYVNIAKHYIDECDQLLERGYVRPKLRTTFVQTNEREILNSSFVVGDAKILKPSPFNTKRDKETHAESAQFQSAEKCEYCLLTKRRVDCSERYMS